MCALPLEVSLSCFRCLVRPPRNSRHVCQAIADDLIAWVQENGGKVWEGVEVTSTLSSGLGLKTTQACPGGTPFHRENCQIQSAYVLESGASRKVVLLPHRLCQICTPASSTFLIVFPDF